jgi:hypothetical protein
MTKEEFAETIFRMHEILHEIDLSDTTIGQCGQCRGLDEPTHYDLCPDCHKALEERLLLIEHTPLDMEFRTLLEAVQDALEDDEELISVLISSRQGSRAVH